MKLIVDLAPVLVFFVVYKWQGVYAATMAAMATAILQALFAWFRVGRLEKMHWVNLGLILVFGGATLLFRNPLFIQWKPTVLYWALCIAFIGSAFIGEKPIAQRMMESQIQLPDQRIWRRLNWAWAVFFFVCGALNLTVAYLFDQDVWVNFKLFGLMGLTLTFILFQAWRLAPYMQESVVEKEE